LKQQNCTTPFEKILLAVDPADLNLWAKEVATEKAETDLANRKKKEA
jgi:hypothetical protein